MQSVHMSLKNARTLGIRLDQSETDRLQKFETETTMDGVSLARAALKAALTYYEETGSISLPLYITSKSLKIIHGVNEFPVVPPVKTDAPLPVNRVKYTDTKPSRK